MAKSPHPQGPERTRPSESEFRGRCVLQPSSRRGKTPGNLRFSAPSKGRKCEVGGPTGAAVGTGIQPALALASFCFAMLIHSDIVPA